MVWRESGPAPGSGYCIGDLPGGGRFRVTDRGAALTQWEVPGLTDQVPVFWNGPTNPDTMPSAGLRMAFPWVGGGREGFGRPLHGLVGEVDWELGRIVDHSEGQEIWWSLNDEPTHAFRQHPEAPAIPAFEAWVRQRFNPDPDIQLHIRNTGDEVTAQTVGFLAALRVGDATRSRIEGLNGCDWSGLDSVIRDTCIGDLALDQPMSRLFELPRLDRTELVLHDDALGRRVHLSASGVGQVFVWLPDFGEAAEQNRAGEAAPGAEDQDADQQYVLIGLLNTRRRVVRLMSGQTHRVGLQLRLEDADGN